MNENILNFRAWVPVTYYDKNGFDCETKIHIENVAVYSDGACGCSEKDLDTALINLNLSELDEASARDYIENNYSTESDLWYFFDSAGVVVEQTTGFVDKNKKLIYTDDILEISSILQPNQKHKATVYWDAKRGAFCLYHWHNDKRDYLADYLDYLMEYNKQIDFLDK